MSFLNLQPPENELTIDHLHPRNSPSSSFLSSLHNIEQRVFSCSYCRRKFYSPQAFGGHQNAHKLERTLAKKSRELSPSSKHQSKENHESSRFDSHGSPYVGRVQPLAALGCEDQEHLVRFGSAGITRDMDYGHKGENVEDDFNQLDLSLKL